MNDPTAIPEGKTLYSGSSRDSGEDLNRVERSDSYLDKVLDAELKSPDLNDPDKGLLTKSSTAFCAG